MVAKVWQRILHDSHIKLLENLIKSLSVFSWWRTVFIESPTGDSPCHHNTAHDEDGGVFSKADVLRRRLQSSAEAHYELQLAKICFAHGATFTSAMKGPTKVLPPWAMGLKRIPHNGGLSLIEKTRGQAKIDPQGPMPCCS